MKKSIDEKKGKIALKNQKIWLTIMWGEILSPKEKLKYLIIKTLQVSVRNYEG